MLFKIDLHRYGKNFFKCFLFIPGYRFIVIKRLCERLGPAHPVGVIGRLWYKNLQVKYGYQIPHKCKVGKGFRLAHYGGVVINQSVEIGDNCSVAQGVTLGYVSRGSKKGSPKIGNRVWIGANAVVVGNINIGDDVLIAPLSYVNKSIPNKAVVAGNPAAIINTKGSEGYLKMYD